MKTSRPSFALAIVILAFSSKSHAASNCQSNGTSLENAVSRYPLTRTSIEKLVKVASIRKKYNIDIVPGFPFCADFPYLNRQVSKSYVTRKALRRVNLSSSEYIVGMWSIAIAEDMSLFSDRPWARGNSILLNNSRLIEADLTARSLLDKLRH